MGDLGYSNPYTSSNNYGYQAHPSYGFWAGRPLVGSGSWQDMPEQQLNQFAQRLPFYFPQTQKMGMIANRDPRAQAWGVQNQQAPQMSPSHSFNQGGMSPFGQTQKMAMIRSGAPQAQQWGVQNTQGPQTEEQQLARFKNQGRRF